MGDHTINKDYNRVNRKLAKDEILEFCKRISYNFFSQNYTKINFTTNNPVYIKTLELNDKDTSI